MCAAAVVRNVIQQKAHGGGGVGFDRRSLTRTKIIQVVLELERYGLRKQILALKSSVIHSSQTRCYIDQNYRSKFISLGYTSLKFNLSKCEQTKVCIYLLFVTKKTYKKTYKTYVLKEKTTHCTFLGSKIPMTKFNQEKIPIGSISHI